MMHIDSEFTADLDRARKLLQKIEKRLAYTGEDLPEDLDSIESQREIETFSRWSISLEDEVLELLALAENMKVCETLRETFYELENELLPDEGIRTGALIGE